MRSILPNRLSHYFIFLLFFNTATAAVLTVLGNDRHFLNELIYSHAIGFSCGVPAVGVIRLAHDTRQLRNGLIASIVFGVIAGVSIASLVTSYLPHAKSIDPLHAIVVGLVLGVVAGYYFFTREGTVRLEVELQRQRERRLELDRAHADMQLRMLQAQVEPHFLFNTLANVSALIRSDPPRAEKLLQHLNAFLRATLQRSRVRNPTLGDEVALVRDYLSIVELRMGARLRWRIEVPDELLGLSLPMFLVQPLVENAVRHGIEPKREGGSVTLLARRDNGRLRIEVVDTGIGLDETHDGSGFGLENIRERLVGHYGPGARLEVERNESGGATATLEIPS